ncbi:MAG: threonine/serine exporter family protein [Bacillota bacterium]
MLKVLWAAIASALFGILFAVPRRWLFTAAAGGGLGWASYTWLTAINLNGIVAMFLAAVMVALFSQTAARLGKVPVPIFLVPGVVPLVPGASAYEAMFNLVHGQTAAGLAKTVETLLLGLAIAGGLALGAALFRARTGGKANVA